MSAVVRTKGLPSGVLKKMAEVKNSSLGGNLRKPIGSCFSGEKTEVIVDFWKFIGSEKNLQASGKIKHKNLRCP